MNITLTNVRITFPRLFPGQEEQFDNKGDAYWGASFLMGKDHPDIPKLKEAIAKVVQEKFAKGADTVLKGYAAKDKLPLHDGDLKADKPYGAAYAGMLYVSARNNAKRPPAPIVFANENDPQTGERRIIRDAQDPKAPYSGCYVHVKLDLFHYNQGGGAGVGASITGVAFAKDGERLAGGVVASASDFESVMDDLMPMGDSTEGKGAASLF